jgi:hypothetical protein
MQGSIINALASLGWKVSQNVIVGRWKVDLVARTPENKLLVIELKATKPSIPDVLRVASVSRLLDQDKQHCSAIIITCDRTSRIVNEVAKRNDVTIITETDVKKVKNEIMRRVDSQDKLKIYKRLLAIIIYGSYHPPNQKERLLKLRDYLRTKGYESTYLVEDLSPHLPSRDAWSISKFAIENADLNLFVFSFQADLGGVSLELDWALRQPNHSVKSVAFVEITQKGRPAISSLLLGRALEEGQRVRIRYFSDDAELHSAALNTVLSELFMYSKIPNFFKRPNPLTERTDRSNTL